MRRHARREQFETNATYTGSNSTGVLTATIPGARLPHASMQFRVRLNPFTNNNGNRADKGKPVRAGEDVLVLSNTKLKVEYR